MSVTQLMPIPVQTFVDGNGNVLAGGLLYSYQAGTTTPQSTYTDNTGSVANANPVVLNSAGPAQVWLSALAYKLVLKNSSGTTIWTVDNVNYLNPAGLVLGMFPTGLFTANSAGRLPFAANFVNTAMCDTVGPMLPNSSGGRAIMAPGFLSADTLGRALTAANYTTRAMMVSPGQQLSSSSATFSDSTGAFVDVTNLSISLTTNGNPVFVGLVSDGTNNSASVSLSKTSTVTSGNVSILSSSNGGSTWSTLVVLGVGVSALGNGANALLITLPLSAFSHYDVAAANSWMYKVQVQSPTGGSIGVNHAKLFAYEIK